MNSALKIMMKNVLGSLGMMAFGMIVDKNIHCVLNKTSLISAI